MKLVLIRIKARMNKAVKVQEVLTQFGCDIALRLGLHEVSEGQCADDGIIILQLKSKAANHGSLQKALEGLGDVTVKIVDF